MKTRAILTLPENNDPLVQIFNFSGLNLAEVSIQSQVFALPSLYKHLIKRAEELLPIEANGKLGKATSVSFSNIDAGTLSARFLSDLGKFLDNAATLGLINNDINKLLQAKKVLAANIAAELTILNDTNESVEPRALAMMVESFAQYLDANISHAYRINALVQFELSQAGNNRSRQYITFFPAVDQPAHQTSVTGTLRLAEKKTGSQPETPRSYEVEIPVPLIELPAPPMLLKDEAIQSAPDGAQAVNELTLWNYNLDFILPDAAQDQAIINVRFNGIPANDLLNTATYTKDLFSALAQYEYVAVGLWEILETGVANSSQYKNAVNTFAYLIENIVDFWSARSARAALYSISETTHQFITRSEYNENSDLSAITLYKTSSNNDPNINWPLLSIKGPSGSFIQLQAEKLTDNTFKYIIPAGMDRQVTIQLSWSRLPFEKVFTADAQLKTERNRELISGTNTNPAFILTSNTLNADSVSPIFRFDSPIDITKPKSNFEIELKAFFAQLFNEITDDKTGSIELNYLQPLSEDSESPVIRLPVLLVSVTNLSAQTITAVANAAQQWFNTNQPPIKNAKWALSLKVYETKAPDKVILNIEQLEYKLDGQKLAS